MAPLLLQYSSEDFHQSGSKAELKGINGEETSLFNLQSQTSTAAVVMRTGSLS